MTTSAAKGFPGSLGLASVSLLLLVSCSPEPSSEIVSFGGRTMGTSYTVRLAPADGNIVRQTDLKDIQRQVDQRLAEINRLMSTYDPNSELSRFNQADSTDWYIVSPETATVVNEALSVADRTQGAFDPTVGPVVNLWGFGPQKKLGRPPTDEEIQEALSRVGYQLVEVRRDPPAIKKKKAEVYLDLSGIAKGYASDKISDLLAKLGYLHSMVEIGGEVRTRGEKPGGKPWIIGVQKPDANPVQTAVPLKDAAMATSGDYRNYFEHEGVRYSHTIDPNTGRPVAHNLASVTIVSDACMEADALATAVLVMGDREGYDWCEEQNVAALFLVRERDEVVETRSTEFERLLEKQ